MKKITVTLTDEAEKVFNDLMYSLPKDEDGTGMCTQSQAINYSLEALSDLEAKGHFAFMDDPPQSSKENNADITKVNGVFVNPSPKAVTDLGIAFNKYSESSIDYYTPELSKADKGCLEQLAYDSFQAGAKLKGEAKHNRSIPDEDGGM